MVALHGHACSFFTPPGASGVRKREAIVYPGEKEASEGGLTGSERHGDGTRISERQGLRTVQRLEGSSYIRKQGEHKTVLSVFECKL